MKKNMGTIDKLIRLAITAAIIVLFYLHIVSGILGIVLLVLAGINALATLVSSCPMYTMMGFSTNNQKKAKETL